MHRDYTETGAASFWGRSRRLEIACLLLLLAVGLLLRAGHLAPPAGFEVDRSAQAEATAARIFLQLGGRPEAIAAPGQGAGQPILAAENIEQTMSLPAEMAGDQTFILRVRGDSMVNAGILDGDYVVVRRQQDAQNGDIVAALAGEDEIADEATVKRFFREAGQIRLQPENDALEPIYAPHVQILGKVIGVFRRL